jgi:mannose/fructose-specific phosphotransferase system component IIA
MLQMWKKCTRRHTETLPQASKKKETITGQSINLLIDLVSEREHRSMELQLLFIQRDLIANISREQS